MLFDLLISERQIFKRFEEIVSTLKRGYAIRLLWWFVKRCEGCLLFMMGCFVLIGHEELIRIIGIMITPEENPDKEINSFVHKIAKQQLNLIE